MTTTDTRPKLNDKLINCVLEHIEHEVKMGHKGYDQNVWASIEVRGTRAIKCRTAGCFAGWTCMLSTPQEDWYKTFKLDVDADGDAYHWSQVARKKLGLTDCEADYLFGGLAQRYPADQLEQVKKRIENIREARRRKVSLFAVIGGVGGE